MKMLFLHKSRMNFLSYVAVVEEIGYNISFEDSSIFHEIKINLTLR